MQVEAEIVNKINWEGHPFSEVHYTITHDDGSVQFALSRDWFPRNDSPHAKAAEVAAFMGRLNRFPSECLG